MAAKTASNGAASVASGAISEKPVAQFQLQPSEAGSRPPLSDQVLFLLIYQQIDSTTDFTLKLKLYEVSKTVT
jgi:hypothetical protein